MQIPIDHYASGEYLYEQITAPVCQKYDLTRMEFTVLMFLANNPKYDTAAQIVKYRRLTKSHVSLAVGRLQERGLLLGTHPEGDRRTVCLKLTEAAQPIVEQGRKAQADFQQALFEGFTEEEEILLGQYMARIDQNIERTMRQLKKVKESKHGTK